MFHHRSVNRLQDTGLIFVALPWTPKDVKRFSIAGVMIKDAIGNSFLDLVPECFDALPVLRSQKRKQQFSSDRERNQFGG